MSPLDALSACAGTWRGTSTLPIVIHNVWPEEQGGKEELAVEAVYARG